MTDDILTRKGWNFDNSYSKLPEAFYSKLAPTPVHSPKPVIFNYELAEFLGLDSELIKSEHFIFELAGNIVPEGADPLAQAYAGHQFGHFTMLGDGRAILLGEQIAPNGERYDVQLKGSGKTPFSRGGDGRAALGPMLREYIISEAMHALNIPTTRSLAVVTTGEKVYRDTPLPGAVLTRVAKSHIRVGTFQYISKWGAREELKALADYTIERHFPNAFSNAHPYINLLREVIKSQAQLIAKWQLAGFVHGVMNTDNMAISGETIDYGPCAFMDAYDPDTVFSSIDTRGRYAYGNQPHIAGWNLTRFAEALLPLIDKNKETAVQVAQDTLSEFPSLYEAAWMSGMRSKLGLFSQDPEDSKLIAELLELMYINKLDYTNTFRALTLNKLENLIKLPGFSDWHDRWQSRLSQQEAYDSSSSYALMRHSNPTVIPRNHRVEEALEAADSEDYSLLNNLLDVITKPFDYSKLPDEYYSLPSQSKCPYKTFCGT